METGSIQKKIAVACVLWRGDFRGRNYTPTWANRLKCMVDRNLDIPYDFYCFTNTNSKVNDAINPIPLKSNWPGWWAKMELFNSPQLYTYDSVLVLDLDTILLRSLSELFDHAEGSTICFAPQTEMNLGNIDKEGKRRVQRYRTGCFLYSPKNLKEVTFKEQAIKKYRGDQDWWGDYFPEGRTFPQEWFMKTKHVKNGKMPKEPVKIVFCNHIKNEAAAKKWPWANEAWSC